MICPRCKEKNSAEARACKGCGLKLKTICPRCQEPNKLGQPKCTKCNLTLIRFCPECKAPNFPHVRNCRKCGAEMRKKTVSSQKQKHEKPTETPIKEETSQAEQVKASVIEEKEVSESTSQPEPVKKPEKEPQKTQEASQELPSEPKIEPSPSEEQIKPEEKPESGKESYRKELNRNEAALFMQELFSKADQGYLVSLCAPNGTGKSTITSSLTKGIEEKQIIWLIGQCEPNKRNIPYNFFRDLMGTLLGIPILAADKEETKKSLRNNLETKLEITDGKVLNVLYRVVLNEYKECSDTIEINHDEVMESIRVFLSSLEKKAPLVIIAEDFEYIDRASFECIQYLLKNGFLDNKNFLLINHTESTNTVKLFPEQVAAGKFLQILFKPIANEELNNIILSMMNNQDILPEELKYRIFRQSKGMPVYVEQALWYLFQIGAIYADEKGLNFNAQHINVEIIPDFSELFTQRLEMIEKVSPEAEKIIYSAAMFGFKFVPAFIQAIAEIENEQMEKVLHLLVNNGIFSVLDQQTFAFKHINLWQIVFERALKNGKIRQISQKMLSVLKNSPTTSSAFLTMLAEFVDDKENMLYYYNRAGQESFFLGDSFSYTENQLKVYELLPLSKLSEEEKEAAKLNICEQIGKVNFELNPSVSMKYLTEAVKKYEETGNNVKIIELTGYLSKSCELVGDYTGVLDCAERAVALTKKPESSIEVMLLNYPKIDASFNLGRLQETIVSVQDDFLPYLNKIISRNETLPGLSMSDIKTIEYEAEYTLAKALIFQGNKQALQVLNKLAARAEKEKQTEYELKALLGIALFSVIQGNLKTCENIFENIREKGLPVNELSETRLQWFFISVLLSMMAGKIEEARGICYSAMSLAKESRNFNIFVLVKLLSGYFYQYFQYYKNATTIYEETANYCSETKMATGALYSWYFAAEAEMQTGNPEKAKEIVENAVDIAEKPNINNFLAIILLSKLLAEIKITKGDPEGAQISVEKALSLAEENDLYYPSVELYITLGKIYQETASANEEKRDYACNYAYKAYSKAYSIAEKIENDIILEKVEKSLSNLNTFCKLSGITLEK